MEVVVWLLLALAFIILIGHGLWVLLSWVFRSLTGNNPTAPRPGPFTSCVRCGREMTFGQNDCHECGLSQTSAQAAELADLWAAGRQLQRFLERGVLDEATFERLETLVELRRRTLIGRPSVVPSPAPAVPVPAAVLLEEAIPILEGVEEKPEPVSASTAPARVEFPVEEAEPVEAILTAEASPSRPARPPRRTFAEVLAAFMEQKNILWGELVGGLLIVGCSIALVISLWKTLEENPVYQAAIFVSVTAALFGAGLYTLSHWKLESTSRGLLVIATLLVPLNFLAITTGQAQSGGGLLALAVELSALIIFGGLLALAGKVLLPEGRWWFTGAILAMSVSQLLVPRVIHSPAANTWATMLALGSLPLAGHLLGTAGALFRATRRNRLSVRQAIALLGFVGMAAFTLAVALGLLVFRSMDQGGSLIEGLRRLAPLLAVAGWPILFAGILIPRHLEETGEDASTAHHTGALHTAGTATALLGMLIMIGAVAAAWPWPIPVIVVCVLNLAPLTFVAFRHRLPVAHVAAIPCLTLGYLAAFNLLAGKLGTEEGLGFALAITPDSGKALAGLVCFLILTAEVFQRLRLSIHGFAYAVGAGGVALLSLVGVTLTVQGQGPDPVPAMILYAAYGTAGLAVNARWRQPLLSSAGLALLAAATLWALEWVWPQRLPLWGLALAIEALFMGLLAAVLGHPTPDRRDSEARSLKAAYAEPLARSAEGVALLALTTAIWGGILTLIWSWANVWTGACLFGLFGLLALMEQRRFLAHLAGYLLLATVAAGIGWAGTLHEEAQLAPWFALGSAACSTFMAGVAVLAGWSMRGENAGVSGSSRWSFAVLSRAWLETGAMAGMLTLALVGLALPAGLSPWHTYSGILLAITALLLAWGRREVVLTWIGCFLFLTSITYGLHQAAGLTIPTHLLDTAFLIHATLLLVAGLLVRRAWGTSAENGSVARLFTDPFRWAGLISSCLALPFLLLTNLQPPLTPALGLFWLSALWLILSWLRGWPWLFTAFQAVLTLAVLFGSLVWLDRQDWFIHSASEGVARFLDPRSLQAYGLSLGLLSLGWVLVRIAWSSHPAVQRLLEPGWPGVDRLVLAALVLAQLVLAVWGVFPALARELALPRLAEMLPDWEPAVRVHAHGPGAWALLGLLVIVLIVALWERSAPVAVLGLVISGITLPILTAASFETGRDVGLVLRWGLAAVFVGISIPIWERDRLQRLGCASAAPFDLAASCRGLTVAGTAVPVILLTILTALAHWGEASPLGSIGISWLGRLPWLLVAAPPLVFVSLGLLGHALRERSAPYAFAAGLVANVTASLIVWHFHPLGLEGWRVLLIQANVIAGSLVALLWLGLTHRLYSRGELTFTSTPFLPLQAALALAGNFVLLLAPVAGLILDPGGPLPLEALRVGHVWGWAALTLAAAASVWYAVRLAPAILIHLLPCLGLAFGALVAVTAGRAGEANWPAFHCLLAAWTLAGPLTLALGWAVENRLVYSSGTGQLLAGSRTTDLASRVFLWVRALGVLAVLLAWRGAVAHDPGNPYWSAGASLAVLITIGTLALWSRQPVDVYASGLLVNGVGSLIWLSWGSHTFADFAATQALCFALASALWTALELAMRGSRPVQPPRDQWPPFSHVAATLALGVLGVLAIGAIGSSLTAEAAWAAAPLTWTALTVLVLAFGLLLWDPAATYVPAGLYAAALVGVVLLLHGLNLSPRDFCWAAPLALAPVVLLAAGIQWGANRLIGSLRALGLPDRPSVWFLPAQAIVAGLALALSVWVVLDFPSLAERLAGPSTVALLVFAGFLMADGSVRSGSVLRTATLWTAAAGAVAIGWAFLDPSGREPAWLWLHRSVIAMAALAAMTVLYGVVMTRWASGAAGWAESGRRLGPVLGMVAALLVAVILIQEAVLYEGHKNIAALLARMLHLPPPQGLNPGVPPTGAPMAPLAVWTVAGALLALIVASVRFALLPGADPLGLSERGRTLYVYGAEVLLVLLFIHFRLAFPHVFRQGVFLRYWPFIVMAIAFSGVALSEFLHRQKVRVLAEPLERTGVFLPMLPVLAFWVLPGDRYALLWFSAGLIYAFLFVARQSFRFGLLAALAANAGLWVLLYNHQWFFHEHPQIWLIPLALIGLVSEYLNRDRLTPAQSAGLRYLALIVIYLSSTADMFIAGLGHSVVLPLVLAGLSVLGVLAGMLLRVRAFLFLGVTFLVFVLLTVIWHAGVDRRQTWILWSAGIVLGVAILTLFGIFEKRRNDVLRLVEELRRWH